jgi:hypothetical protein
VQKKRGNLDQRESRELGTLYQTSSGVHPYSESRVRKVVYQGVTVGKQELKTVQSSK